MGYCLNRLDEPVFIAVSKPLLTEFCIHHRLESCGLFYCWNILATCSVFQGASFQRIECISFRYQYCISMVLRIVSPDAQNCGLFFVLTFFVDCKEKLLAIMIMQNQVLLGPIFRTLHRQMQSKVLALTHSAHFL